MIENPLGIPRLPENLDLLVPGEVYLVPEDAGVQVILRHCTGLNCSQNASDGTIEFGIINTDVHTSTPFTARPGTQLRAIYPTEASCKCGQCNRYCVTLGLHNSDEIYNVRIQSKTPEDPPKYGSQMQWVPVGSVVRLLGDRYSQLFGGEDSNEVVYSPHKSDKDYTVGVSNRGHTLRHMTEGTSHHDGITYLLPDDLMVGIVTSPENAKYWSTCWDLKEPKEPHHQPGYWGEVRELPKGSLVKVPVGSSGRRILENGDIQPESKMEETLFAVGFRDGKYLMEGVFRVSDTFEEHDCSPKDYVVSNSMRLNVITTPRESQLWATVRENENPGQRMVRLKESLSSLFGKLLGNLRVSTNR